MKDFFISYTAADRAWAEWIGYVLEEQGFTVIIQAWDFRPGSNFVLEMQRAATDADRTIMVLSPDYLKSQFTSPEWAAALTLDPQGLNRKLVPVMVRQCEAPGLLTSLVHIRLVDQDEVAARSLLLNGLNEKRAKPARRPSFPGSTNRNAVKPYPGAGATPSGSLKASSTPRGYAPERTTDEQQRERSESEKPPVIALRVEGVEPSKKPSHAVILIHGIRTQGEWQQRVKGILEDPDTTVIPTRFEFFDLVSFLLPMNALRMRPVNRILRQIRVVNSWDHISKLTLVCHSFGTWIAAKILEQHPDLWFHRLVLCGSVIPDSFEWDRYAGQLGEVGSPGHVVNECGMNDILPVLAASITWGYGSSGRFGFGHALVTDRFHQVGHSGYFSDPFIRKYWIPFIKRGQIVSGELAVATTPYWVSLLTVFKLRYFIVALLVAAVAFPTFQHSELLEYGYRVLLGQSFTKAASGDLDPITDTCLDGPTQIIPAGTEVCANMHGQWLDGRGPLGQCRKGGMTIWTRQARAPYAELTSKHMYQHMDRFRESTDYVVCVSPPENAVRTNDKAHRMAIDVWPKSWPKSLGECIPVEEFPCPHTP